MPPQVVQELAGSLCSIVENGMEIWKLDAQAKAYWEKTRADIERISKEADVRLSELQHDLEHAKDKTERLRILVETINRNPNLPPLLQEGIAKALDNVTRQ